VRSAAATSITPVIKRSSGFGIKLLRLSALAFGVGLPRQIGATFHQIGERLGVVEKNAIVRHFLVIRFKRFQRLVTGNELQIAGNGRGVVDRIAGCVLGSEEPALKLRNLGPRGTGSNNFQPCDTSV
jgi:hypothetical protein